MPDYVVKQGDCLSSIAHANGFAKPMDLWQDPKNAALRDKRHDDPSVLFPGDVLWIPDKTPKTVDKPTGAKHAFTAKVPARSLHVVVRDSKDQPVAGKTWKLTFGNQTKTGTTDGTGAVIVAKLDAWISEATLKVEDVVWNLAIGHLNPIHETPDGGDSGANARLHNMGYLHDPNASGEKAKTGVKRFQAAHDLPATGAVDAPTKDKLLQAHKDEVKPTPPKPPADPPPGASGFTVKVVDKLPDTPPLCSLKVKSSKKKAAANAVAPVTVNVLAPPRKGRCSLCAKADDCLDNDYDFLLAVGQMAARLKGDAGAFLGIMHFETGHTYSAKIQNSIKATGLIQIIPGTAKGLNTTTDALKDMCRIEQLGYVEKYFVAQRKSYPKADYTTVRDVVLAVFEPAGLDPDHEILGVSADQCKGPFDETDKHGKKKKYWTATFRGQEVHVSSHQLAVYKGNAGLDRDKDGFIVREDYPTIVNGLLASCAKACADKGRELQQSLGASPPEYQIIAPGKAAAKAGGAS